MTNETKTAPDDASAPHGCDGEDYLVWSNMSAEYGRLVGCVDTLGEPKRLRIVDNFKMDLETDEGHWILDRRAYEPAFAECGFVSVELPDLGGRKALYFNVRVFAALAKAGIRYAYTDRNFKFEKGVDVPLFTEWESFAIVRTETNIDLWAINYVDRVTAWIGRDGKPVPTGR